MRQVQRPTSVWASVGAAVVVLWAPAGRCSARHRASKALGRVGGKKLSGEDARGAMEPRREMVTADRVAPDRWPLAMGWRRMGLDILAHCI